jgi:adenine phosphoribosyltransferase
LIEATLPVIQLSSRRAGYSEVMGIPPAQGNRKAGRSTPTADGLPALVLPLIREVANFPQFGVLFRDVAPVFADAAAFHAVVDGLVAVVQEIDIVIGVEARGFLLGAAVAYALGTGVVGVRKPGKLPVVSDRESYALEYGAASLELADGVLWPGQRALVVDDVLATGGTVSATCALVERAGVTVSGIAVLLEIASLRGRDRLHGRSVHALLTV